MHKSDLIPFLTKHWFKTLSEFNAKHLQVTLVTKVPWYAEKKLQFWHKFSSKSLAYLECETFFNVFENLRF